jgi:glycosyltransferase involved in cell wall biosynthesis
MNDLVPRSQPSHRDNPNGAPAVSVVLPTFNRVHFLRPAVASVLAQTYRDWELLIADDGSDEETRIYLRGLADPRIRLIWLKHTGKPAIVRNAALRQARGAYVAFMDSDDLWLASKLQLQMDSLGRHPGRAWSLTGFAVIDAGDNRQRSMKVAGGWILDKLIGEEMTIATPSVLVARGLLEELSGFDEELISCEDYELWLRVAARTEADLVDQPLTLVRRHTEHYSSEVMCLQDLARMLEKVQESGIASQMPALLQWRRAKCAAALAQAYAACGQRRRAMATLSSSLRYSWRHKAWRDGALSAAMRVLLPETAARIIRSYRSGSRRPLPDRSKE